MNKGKFYDLDKSKKPVSDHTFETWIDEGAAMLKEDWIALQEKKEATPEPESEEETDEDDDIIEESDLHTMKKLSDEPPDETKDLKPYKEPEITGIPFDSDNFDCPKTDCYRHGDPYKNSWSYISHMKKQHGEKWEKKGDMLVPDVD